MDQNNIYNEIDLNSLFTLEDGECPSTPPSSDSESSTDWLEFTRSLQISHNPEYYIPPDSPMEEDECNISAINLPEVVSELSLVGLLRLGKNGINYIGRVDGTGDLSPLGEDTVLLLARDCALGTVREIYGHVEKPCYVISLCEEALVLIEDGRVKSGAEVFCVPGDIRLTHFVFNVDSLKQNQGSDASWIGNAEPPPNHIDYSDDEQEKRSKFEAAQLRIGVTEEEARRLYDEKKQKKCSKRNTNLRRPQTNNLMWPPQWPPAFPRPCFRPQMRPYYRPPSQNYFPYPYNPFYRPPNN